MTTPTKNEIIQKATELYMQDNWKNFDTTPEPEELKEEGYTQRARNELMSNVGNGFFEDIKDLVAESEYKLVKIKENEQQKPSDFENFPVETKETFDPQEALKSGCYISGTTGSGKSDLGMLHAEQLMHEDVTVIVFDATMDWMRRSSVPYVITVEPEKNFQYSFDLEHSFIFDMSLLNVEQQKQLVKMVCSELWHHQVRAAQAGKTLQWFYVVFEEGHIYFPQGCMRSKEYGQLVQIVTGGRNFKIRFEVITQFASMIDKDVMKYMRQRYFGYTDEPNDTEYVSGFLGREYSKQLESLKAGQFLYKYGRQIREIYNPIYESKTEPQPYPKLLDVQAEQKEVEEQTEQAEPQEVNWLQLAQAGFQVGSLLVFLVVLAIAFLN